MYDFAPLSISCGGAVNKTVYNSVIDEFSSSEYDFNYISGDNITLWDEIIYQNKTRETLGAYWIENINETSADYILSVNSIAYES